MKTKKYYTLLLSSNDKRGQVRQYTLSSRTLRAAAAGVLSLGIILAWGAGAYFFGFSSQKSRLKQHKKNQALLVQVSQAQKHIQLLNARVNQIEDFSYKLKILAGVEKTTPLPLAAIGPLPNDAKNRVWPIAPMAEPSKPAAAPREKPFVKPPGGGMDSLMIHIEQLNKKSLLVQQDIHSLMKQLYTKKDIINSTPSLLPVRGWVSSRFGYRRYPFTGEAALHEGIDIAALPGAPVYAPAPGEVVFAGYKTGYGQVIILDHGWRLSTLYGHLSDIMVSVRQQVQRKQVIGAAGSTGHSSGPHLHYEVRIAGVPVDPSHYILNEL